MARQTVTSKQSGSRLRAVGDVIGELKKVVWLSRREVVYLTGLVLLITVIVAAMLGVIDLGFTDVMNKFFLGG